MINGVSVPAKRNVEEALRAVASNGEEPKAKDIPRRRIKWNKQDILRKDGSLLKTEISENLLTRSITLALEAVGFEAAEVAALNGLRDHAEEYMTHMASMVRQNMLASRRTRTSPQDFISALHRERLSLRCLVPHLDPPVQTRKSQYRLQQEEDVENDVSRPYQSLDCLLGIPGEKTRIWIPSHFPQLPDEHTFKSTARYPKRENDPRRIREMAAEQGRLAEGALRKVARAETAQVFQHMPQVHDKSSSLGARRKQMWTEVLSAYTGGPDSGPSIKGEDRDKDEDQIMTGMSFDPADIHPSQTSQKLSTDRYLSVGVNYEKQYWRTPAR